MEDETELSIGIAAKHAFISYAPESTFGILGRSCVRCGLPPENEIHRVFEIKNHWQFTEKSV